MLQLFDRADNIASTLTIAMIALSAVSLMIANLSRYIKAKKFGIPLDLVHPASIQDSVDIWVLLIGVFGLGNVAFSYMGEGLFSNTTTFVIAFLAAFFSLFIARPPRWLFLGKRKFNVGRMSHPLICVFVTLIIATSYTYMNSVVRFADGRPVNVGNVDEETGAIQWGVFIVINPDSDDAELLEMDANWVLLLVILLGAYIHQVYLIFLLLLNFYFRLYGGNDVSTIDIGEQTHLITMRHNSGQYILIPCELTEEAQSKRKRKPPIKVLRFPKGEFIIRDLSIIEGSSVIYRQDYKITSVVYRRIVRPDVYE